MAYVNMMSCWTFEHAEKRKVKFVGHPHLLPHPECQLSGLDLCWMQKTTIAWSSALVISRTRLCWDEWQGLWSLMWKKMQGLRLRLLYDSKTNFCNSKHSMTRKEHCWSRTSIYSPWLIEHLFVSQTSYLRILDACFKTCRLRRLHQDTDPPSLDLWGQDQSLLLSQLLTKLFQITRCKFQRK